MPSQTQRYTIQADSSQAEQANARVNSGIASMGSTAQASTAQASKSYEQYARTLSESNRQAEASTNSHARKLAELGVTGVAAYEAMGTAASRYSAQAASASAATDSLASRLGTLYRVARVALSPTLPTIAGLAVAYGVERTVQYGYERGGQINQQAFQAASGNTSLAQIEQIQTLAKSRGDQQDSLVQAAANLRKSLGTDAGQSALAGLGVSDSGSDIDNLKNLASAFSAVADPVEKARLAIELFGPSAQTILPELSQSFADSASNIEKWGVTIGTDRAAEITTFKSNVDELKKSVFSLGDFLTVGEQKIKNFFAGIGAAAGNSLFNVAALFGPKATDAQTALITAAGVAKNSTLARGGTGPDYEIYDAVQSAANGDVNSRLAQAQSQLTNTAKVLAAGYIPNPKTGKLDPLTDAQNSNLSTQFVNSQRQVADLTAQKAAIDKATQDKTDAEANALDEKRKASELSRTLTQLAAKSGDPGPFGAIFTEIQKARTSVDKGGDIVTRDLTPQEQIDAARAYHNVISELQKKDSTEAVKQINEEQELQLRYADELFTKRQQKEQEIGLIRRDTFAKEFAQQNADLDSSKESALNALKLSQPNGLQEIAGNLDIASRYANESAQLDIERIQRKQLSDLADRGLSPDAIYAPDSEEAKLRSAIVENSGVDAAAVARKNTADLLHAQEQAQVASADLIKDANEKSFNSLKDQALSVLDTIESHGKNVFQALGDTLKKSVLGAVNDILSSQIASGLFGLFNPGREVTGFESQNGIKQPGLSGAFQRLGLGGTPNFSGGIAGFTPSFAGGAPAGSTTFVQGAQDVIPASGFIGANDAATSQIETINGTGPQASLNRPGGFGGRFGFSPSLLEQLAGAAPAIAGQSDYGTDSFKRTADIVPSGASGNPDDAFAGQQAPGLAPFTPSYATYAAGAIGVAALNSTPNYGGGQVGQSPIGQAAPGGIKGLFGKLTGKGGLGSLKDAVYNSGSIDIGPGLPTTAAGISSGVAASLGGGIIGKAAGSVVGGVAGFAASDAGAAVGGSLLLGGLSAKHSSVLTDASDTVGGALLGANIGARTPGVGEGPGAVIGAGGGLLAAGLKRGGIGGLGEDAVGGAAAGAGVGFTVGGPIGALIGAGVGAAAGALAGFVRLFVKGDRQQIKDQVKNAYHLNISDSLADQIQQIAKQNFGGSYSIAIRSPQVLDLLNLYAQVTGQPFLIKNKPYAAYLTETTGGLKQVAQYVNGAPVSYASQAGVGVLNNQATTVLSNYSISQATQRNHGNATDYNFTTPATQQLTVQLDGQSSAAFLQGQTVAAIGSNPNVVTQANSDSYNSNFQRTQTALQLISPGLLYN